MLIFTDAKLTEVQKQLKISKKDFKLLMEAYRRINFLSAREEFVGLGKGKEYVSQYFTPSFRISDYAHLNWFKLNEKGKEMMQIIQGHFPPEFYKINKGLGNDAEISAANNEFLFQY